MSKAINYIGLAKKAGLLVTGEDNSAKEIKSGKAKLLIVSSDTSAAALRRAEGYVYETPTLMGVVPYTKDEVSQICGKPGCSMAVFTDIGLADSFVKALEAEYGEKYASLSEKLGARKTRAVQRAKAKTAQKSKPGTIKRRK